MNSMKSAFAMFAFLVVGIGTGLMVRVGFSATVQPGVDVKWFDESLVGATAGLPPALLDSAPCVGCEDPQDWTRVDLLSTGSGSTDETRKIAEHLDLQAVPMLLVSGDQITYVDALQLDSPRRVTTLR